MACPVCFGGDDPVMRESLNAGIGVLMGVTGMVLACLGRFIVVLKRRAAFADQVDFAGGVPAGSPPGGVITNHRGAEAQRS